MGRKRARKAESDDSDCDSDLETIVVDTSQRYGLRPRKAQLFTEDLIDEEDAEYTSDFEDELNDRGRNLRTVAYAANSEEQEIVETDSVDYDEVIAAGVVINENQIDFEQVIEKTEIQIHKRNVASVPSETTPKKRSRKQKILMEKQKAGTMNDGNGEFCHFLDTRDSIAEDIPNLAIGETFDSVEPSELVASILETEPENTEEDKHSTYEADVNSIIAESDSNAAREKTSELTVSKELLLR